MTKNFAEHIMEQKPFHGTHCILNFFSCPKHQIRNLPDKSPFPLAYAGHRSTTMVCAAKMVADFNTNAVIAREITHQTDAINLAWERNIPQVPPFDNSVPVSHPKLPTPIKVQELDVLLRKYPALLRKKLIEGFSQGFIIHYQGNRLVSHYHNHKSIFENLSHAQGKIAHELSMDRMAGPFLAPPFDDFQVSPLGIVPKKEPGTFRLIHDLSFPHGYSINAGIPKQYTSVRYEHFDKLVDMIKIAGVQSYIAKTDIESAFRLLPIHPSCYHLFGFIFQEQFYYDRCLPMGCAESCNLFESLSQAIQWIMRYHFDISSMWHLLDDFVFVYPTAKECDTALEKFIHVSKILGIPIKHSKTFKANTVMTVVGIELDTKTMEARLPVEKLIRARHLLKTISIRKKVTLRELQSLIGFLNFTCSVIRPGRTFLRRLIDLTKGVKRPHHRIRLTQEARADLQAWCTFLNDYNGKSLFLHERWLSSNTLKLYTDAAANYGYAAVFGSAWFYGAWPDGWYKYSIAVLELFPIVAAMELWGHRLRNHCIILYCDNRSVVDILNSQTSKDKYIMILLKRFIIVCMKHNVLFKSEHIQGKLNVIADKLSRFQIAEAQSEAPWLQPQPTLLPESILPWTTL